MTFLDLCDDTMGHTLDMMRPFEAICLGLTCRRLHGLVQERRAAIAAKLWATGYREVCYCVNAQTGTSLGSWLWGHPECARSAPYIRRLCGLAAGGHTELFASTWTTYDAYLCGEITVEETYAVFNAAVGAGEIEIANTILLFMEDQMLHVVPIPDISADAGFMAAATNGHYDKLRAAYVIGGWEMRVWHSRVGIAAAAIHAGAPAEHIANYIDHIGSLYLPRNILQLTLEYRRFDLLDRLVPKTDRTCRCLQLCRLDVEKAGPAIIQDALDRGVLFSVDVMREVLHCGYVREALIMSKRLGWPKHALASATRRASPEDLKLLIATGCPCDPRAIEVALNRGDPEVLRLVAAVPGAYWTEALLERLRREGGAAAELALSAGAPL